MAETIAKQCPRCKRDLTTADFYRCHYRKDGLQHECKACQLVRTKDWQHKNPIKVRGAHYQQKYGITLAHFEAMLERQGGVCALCGGPEIRIDGRTGQVMRLCVDHNHETGEVRGLLCHRCNSAIGVIESLQLDPHAMVRYIDKGAE